MGKDDYKTTGGALKLKGAKPAGIDKSKKKKKKPKTESEGGAEPTISKAAAAEDLPEDMADQETEGKELSEVEAARRELYEVGKTEAERRHEEMRRRRLNDRIAREGVKTHKERVEDLNKYLSTLSEHHDMPRIGPG